VGVGVTPGLVSGGASFQQSVRVARLRLPPEAEAEADTRQGRRRRPRRRALMGLGSAGKPSARQPSALELMAVLLATLSCDAVSLYAMAPNESHVGELYQVRPPPLCSPPRRGMNELFMLK
jgi:hypothetical protein